MKLENLCKKLSKEDLKGEKFNIYKNTLLNNYQFCNVKTELKQKKACILIGTIGGYGYSSFNIEKYDKDDVFVLIENIELKYNDYQRAMLNSIIRG